MWLRALLDPVRVGLLTGAADPELRATDDGLLVASPAEVLASRVVLAIATLWFAAVCLWELFGPILAGHYASAASMGIIAQNMHDWGIREPIWSYSATRPDPALAYCHHPWGIFRTTAVFYDLFGRHSFVCRLPAALLSIATPPLLFALGRDLYRPIAGAAAAAAFVVLPISLAFADFNALEVPVIAYGALFLWSWVRARRTQHTRWFVTMVGAGTLAMNSDWPGFLLVLAILGLEVASFAAGPASLPRRRVLGWIALATAGALVAGYYLVTFLKLGKLGDLGASYNLRSGGAQRRLFAQLDSRRYWIQLSFTPLGVSVGKASAVLVVMRFALIRRIEELVPLTVLFMAAVQYVAFPQGADIHVFWPHHFAMYFALAVAAITASIAPSIARLLQRSRRPAGYAVSLGAVLVPLLAIGRDGVEALVWARRTGGRFSEKGAYIETDGQKIALLSVLDTKLPKRARVSLHDSMHPNWAQSWALGGRVVEPTTIIPNYEPLDTDVLVADLRYLTDDEATRLLFGYEVEAYGSFLVARNGSGLSAWSFHGREPTTSEWMLQSGTEPVWTFLPDDAAAWELGVHYGIDVSMPPNWSPADDAPLEEIRLAHNVAVERKDDALRDELHRRLLDRTTPAEIDFSGAATLRVLGVRVEDGVQPTMTVLMEVDGPLPPSVLPKIRSKVIERPSWSLTMADPTRREVAGPPPLVPTLWRRGFIYSLVAPLLPRPGLEVFTVELTGLHAPRTREGKTSAELFRY